jgi:hypothetical protein
MFSGPEASSHGAPCESNDCSVPNWQILSCATRTANSSVALPVSAVEAEREARQRGILRSENESRAIRPLPIARGRCGPAHMKLGLVRLRSKRIPLSSQLCLLSTFSNMTYSMEMNYGVFVSNVSRTNLFAYICHSTCF